MMKSFLKLLESGTLSVSYCQYCQKYTWPVSPYCKCCVNYTTLKPISDGLGSVLEYCSIASADCTEIFGLVDVSGLRLIGKIAGMSDLLVGTKVRLASCGISANGLPFYLFEAVNLET